MIVVLEGPDGGGKSSLARRLVQAYEVANGPDTAAVWHEGPPPDGADLVGHYELPLTTNRERLTTLDRLFILDRWETGELVYGPLLRGRSRLSPGQALHVGLLLRSLGAVRVLVQPNLAILEDRYDVRGDDLVRREWLPDLATFYADYAHRHHWTIRVTGADDEGDVRFILKQAARITRASWRLDRFPGYVGWLRPQVLLLGDRRGNYPARPGDGSGAWGWGAFTPDGPGGSARWLLDSLERLPELPPFGLANSVEHGQNLCQLWDALGCPPVLALGNAASAVVRKLGIDHARCPHPQWARRFRRKYPDEYTESLGRGIESARNRDDDGGRGVPAPAPTRGGHGAAGEPAPAAG